MAPVVVLAVILLVATTVFALRDAFAGRGSSVMKSRREAITTTLLAVIFVAVFWAANTGRLVMVVVEIVYLAALVHRPVKWEIAAPYKGWVELTYNNPQCEPLTREGRGLVVHIDKSGAGCTSEPMLEGWRRNEYFYVADNGRRTEIPIDDIRALASHQRQESDPDPCDYESYFVGTAEELNRAWSKEPGHVGFRPLNCGREYELH